MTKEGNFKDEKEQQTMQYGETEKEVPSQNSIEDRVVMGTMPFLFFQ